MVNRIPTGGPAFPIECNIENGFRDDSGMTLRDWFAGKSLCGMFNHSGWINTIDDDHAEAARRAYKIADAMLAEKFKAEEINAQADKEDRSDGLW